MDKYYLRQLRQQGQLIILGCLCCLSCLFISCSSDSEDEGEYDNWQERNEAMTAKWATDSSLGKIISFSKEVNSSNKISDYIYVEKIASGEGEGDTPLYTDTVRVAYRGRLIPSKSYPEGLVFDENYSGDFDWNTIGTTDFCCSALVDGFTTALMYMRVGDRWRIRIPYELGYGTSAKNSIPAYSDLIFEVALVDFWHPGEQHSKFK